MPPTGSSTTATFRRDRSSEGKASGFIGLVWGFFALLSFAVLFLHPELSNGMHSAACRGRVGEAKGVFAPWAVASVLSEC